MVAIIMCVLFSTSVFATTSFKIQNVGQNGYSVSIQTEQKMNQNYYATLSVQEGPVWGKAVIYSYVVKNSYGTCKTKTGIYKAGNTLKLDYVDGAFSNTAMNGYYKVAALLQRGCYFTTTTVSGSFTP